jgi:hypothetical protein
LEEEQRRSSDIMAKIDELKANKDYMDEAKIRHLEENISANR